MSPQEHITVCTSEEAGEIAELAFELGRVALKLSKDLHKALRFGFGDTDPSRDKTKIELLAEEINDLHGCIELLQESGIEFPGLFNREAIEAKKAKVKHFMNIAEDLGTVVKPKPKPLTPAERDLAYKLLYDKLNPIQQKEYGKQIYEYVIKKIQEKFIPDDTPVFITDRLLEEINIFKSELIKDLVTSHRYYILQNKDFMDMIDIQITCDNQEINIQPNSVLEVLMHGAAQVKFFSPVSNADLESIWNLYKDEFINSEIKG